ncbi:MAG TPA: ATP-binding protein, partial [Bacteroidia bacterium]|nr:ATP-binding protein [Bacteroidia bacterium]
YLFFVFVTLPFYLFDTRQYSSIAFIVAVYFSFFYIMEAEVVTFPIVLDETGQKIMRFLMVTLVLLWLTANYLYFERTSRQAEEKLRASNARLVQKNKELEQFAYIASHDLQEPLLTINNFTELLNADYGNKLDAEGKLYLGYLSESSRRMRRLVTGLLDYCRLGQNHSPAPVDFNTIVSHVLQDMQATIAKTEAVITVGELPLLSAHETEIRLLFQNLISNAIKFRKKDITPEIHVFAEKLPGYWKFTVSDNGIGMEKKNLDKIFIIFQRLHNRNDYEGSGIGLAHCRKITDLHGGEIWAESEPGSGTAFHFTIPDKQLL